MNGIRKYLLPLLAVILLVVFGLTWRAALMAYIVQPVALLFWAAWRVVASVYQNVYWIFLIVVCFLLILRIAIPKRESRLRSAYKDREASPNPVESWQSLLEEAGLQGQASDELREALKSLVFSAYRMEARNGSLTAEELNAGGMPSLSPEAQQYLFPGTAKRSRLSSLQPRSLIAAVPRQLQPWLRKILRPDYTIINEILTSVETALENHHGK